MTVISQFMDLVAVTCQCNWIAADKWNSKHEHMKKGAMCINGSTLHHLMWVFEYFCVLQAFALTSGTLKTHSTLLAVTDSAFIHYYTASLLMHRKYWHARTVFGIYHLWMAALKLGGATVADFTSSALCYSGSLVCDQAGCYCTILLSTAKLDKACRKNSMNEGMCCLVVLVLLVIHFSPAFV